MTAHVWKADSLRSRVYLSINAAMPRGLTRSELIELMPDVPAKGIESMLGCDYFRQYVTRSGRGEPYRIDERRAAPPLSLAVAAELVFTEIAEAEIGCTDGFLRDVTRIEFEKVGLALAQLEDAGRIERVNFGHARGWRVAAGGKPGLFDLVIPVLAEVNIDAIHRRQQPEADGDGAARIDLAGGRLRIRWAGKSVVLPPAVTAQTAQYLERHYGPRATPSAHTASAGAAS